MKKLIIFFIILFSISLISSLCENRQIDINTASQEELEELYLVGPVKAQSIIDSRPFDSIDELIEIYGIGEKTLEGIIEQGLACVDKEIKDIAEETPKEFTKEGINFVREETGEEEDEEIEIISLTGQTIKSPENNENKSKYAMYGFAGFCVLLGILFMLKKKKYKNEFR